MRAIEQAQPQESTREFIDRILREYLTEREEVIERAAVEWYEGLSLPWWVPGWAVRRLISWAVPDKVLGLLSVLLDRAGLR